MAFAFLTISCKSQVTDDKFITNPDDFSNKEYSQDYNTYLNSLDNTKQLKTVKVFYKEKFYEFQEFKNKIGFVDKLDIKIIKDSVLISEYKVKNCNVLIIAEDK